MFEMHTAKIASGWEKKPNPEVAQRGVLNWPAPDPTTLSSLEPTLTAMGDHIPYAPRTYSLLYTGDLLLLLSEQL